MSRGGAGFSDGGRSGISVLVAKTDGVTAMCETERKYEATSALELPDPARLTGLDTGSGAQEQQLEAVYFDTADLQLVRVGVTLRRRESGSDPGWPLETAGRHGQPRRVRMPLGRSIRKPPAELLALTRVYTRGTAVIPVASADYPTATVAARRPGRPGARRAG